MHFKKVRKLCTGFVILYFAIGILAAPLPRHEIFPFFSWFLFPLTPSEEVSYALKVHKNQGAEISADGWNQGLIPFKGENNIDLHYMCQRLGKAYENQNYEEEEAVLNLLEKHYIRAPYIFDLVKIKYHPVKRWKTGAEETITVRCYEK